VVDGVTLERLGVPAAVVACDLLINSTGKATARLPDHIVGPPHRFA